MLKICFGALSVGADYGAHVLTRLGEGVIDLREARATIKAAAVEGAKSAGPAKTFSDLGADWTSNRIAASHPDHVRVKRSASKDAERLEVLCRTIGRVPASAHRSESWRSSLASSRPRIPSTNRS